MAAQRIETYVGTGRRKTAIARVRIVAGSGNILVNRRELEKYFLVAGEWEMVRAPLKMVNCQKTVDVFIKVTGGGTTGQAGAVSLGMARALVKYNADFEEILREHKLLTRDARKKERKKYGRRGARRGIQFSKR